MNIAELFVNLGIKGADKTVGALSSVKKGLGEISSTSLEAKAAIVAALYAFERMMSVSGQTGTNLTNFAALTGLSAQSLQKWEYAARQAGVSNEELMGSFKGVQGAMADVLLGKGAPEGFAIVKNAVGLDTNRLRDTLYVMGQLQKAAQVLPKDVGNRILAGFHLSEGTIEAMRRNMFNATNFAKAPTYSDREIGSLDKANIAWSNLGNKIEMAFGHFNAKHGGSLVSDISKATDQIFRMIDAFTILAEKLKVFEVIGKAFDGWSMIFKGVADTVGEVNKDKDGLTSGVENKGLEILKGAVELFRSDPYNYKDLVNEHPFKSLAPGIGAAHQEVVSIHQNITHHGDAKDTKSVKDVHKSAINNAYRQRSAQRQGS